MSSLQDEVHGLLQEAARREVLPRFQNLKSEEISSKTSPTDLVTQADIQAEIWLRPQLEKLIPQSMFIGEEAVAESPSLLQTLKPEGVFWIVDPVDGTGNFVKGLERFAMMIALVQNGETTHSWIYSPTKDALACSERGSGAFYQNQKLTMPPAEPIGKAIADYSPAYMPSRLRKTLGRNLEKIAAHHNGRCSAWAYLDCALGTLNTVFAGRLKPWDHAAGTLLIHETGGRSGMLSSGDPYKPEPYIEQPMMSVNNAALWEIYRDAFLQA